MEEQHFRVEIWALQLPCKVSVTCPVNASGSVWQELFPSNLFFGTKKKKWKLYQNHQLFKMTESSVIKTKSAALFTFVKVKFTKHPKLSLFEITQQSIGWKKISSKPSLWKTRLACQREIQQARWHLTSWIYAETIVSTSQPPGPEFPALPIDGWRWPRSMLVHIIIISLRGEGGTVINEGVTFPSVRTSFKVR